jgi:hypothetical protein
MIAIRKNGVLCHSILKYNVTPKTNVRKISSDAENSPAPLLWYTMESGTGTTILDRSESDNDHDATFGASAAALAWDSGGPAQGTYSVTAASGDYATITHHADLDWEYNDAWTVAGYCSTTSATWAGMYVKRSGASGDYRGTAIYIYNGSVWLYLVSTWGSSVIHVKGASDINDGNWHHVVVTYDGSGAATGALAYVNGVADAMTVAHNDLGTNTTKNSVNPRILNSTDTSVYPLGDLDELAIWDVALTPSQIDALYNEGTAINVARGM